LSIGSGKGGVGASMIATNLGIFLAQIGKRVVLIDADITDSGLHFWLGEPRPRRTLGGVLAGRVARIEDAVTETRVTGLFLLAGTPCLAAGNGLDREARARVAAQIRNLETDFVIVDLPSGLHPVALDLFGKADVPIAVTVSTPDAVESTYRFLEAAFWTRLAGHPDADPIARAVLGDLGGRGGRPPTPREIAAALGEEGSSLKAEADLLAATFHPQIVVNQTRIRSDEDLGEAMISAAARWIGIVPRLLGSVGWDDNVWLSLCRGQPLLIDFSRSRACKDLERIVRRLLGQDFKDLFAPAPAPPPTEEQNLYDLLEIYPGASEEEVRRALKRIRDWFGAGGLAVRGVCTEEERLEYQRLVEEAHATLVDKSKRRQYDRSAFPNGFPKATESLPLDGHAAVEPVRATHDSLPRVALEEGDVVDGRFLGRIRRERGVDLVDISNRAKISVAYLKAIEEERYEDLPAEVYVRGFLTEFARYLKIDPQRAVSDFMARLEAAGRGGGK